MALQPPAGGQIVNRLDQLLAVIEGEAAQGQAYLGLKWCCRSRAFLATQMGISLRTLERLLASDAIQKHRCKIDGKTVTLLRRKDGQTTPAYECNISARAMAKIWRDRTGKEPNKKEFGCLIGLAEAWPPNRRLAIFRYTIHSWTEYMANLKFTLKLYHEDATGKDPDDDPAFMKRHYKYPSLTVMRLGPAVALENYKMHLQGKALG